MSKSSTGTEPSCMANVSSPLSSLAIKTVERRGWSVKRVKVLIVATQRNCGENSISRWTLHCDLITRQRCPIKHTDILCILPPSRPLHQRTTNTPAQFYTCWQLSSSSSPLSASPQRSPPCLLAFSLLSIRKKPLPHLDRRVVELSKYRQQYRISLKEHG